MDYARQMVGHIGKRYVLSSLLFEDYFSHMVPWRTPRYSMNARRRVKTMDITRSCLSLVEVLDIGHCSSTLSSDRIFITTQYSYIFHHIFISYFIYYFRLEGELSLRGYARAHIFTDTYFHAFSAVSKRNFARKYAFDSIFQDLQDLHPFAPLQSQNFRKKSV